jgi:NAD(P)-dependent dehydrogenase (short-subunit alcohol dehydrogenase family)
MSSQAYRKLQDKHVLVMGGSSGIGRAVAEAALASGANVSISSSSATRVESAVSQLSAAYPDRTVRGLAVDLSKPTAEADLEGLFQWVGPLDHIVFTAADQLSLGGLDSVSVDLMHQAAHMRMVVPVLVGKMAARYLPKTNLASLTITSGVVAEKPAPGWAVVSYFAGGLVSLARALAVDLAPVRVNVVQPGYIDTGLWSGMSEDARNAMWKSIEETVPTGKVGQAEDVAEAYLWLMKDRNVTATVAATDSGALVV